MSKFIGRRVLIGIGKESSFGTKASTFLSIPKLNVDFDDKANKAISAESLGNISEQGSQAIVTSRFSEGKIDGEINANTFGLILLATFGSDTPSAYSTSAYKHTYSLVNTNAHQSLSILAYDPIGSTLFKGCVLDTLDIDINESDIVKFTAGFKGKKGNDDSTTVSNASADYKFVGRDLEFKVAANQAALAAASAVSVKELKVTINKNSDYDWVLGTLEPETISNRQFMIKGTVTLNYEDRTWRDYMTNGTLKAMGIKLTDTRDVIGSSGNPIFYIELPIVEFSQWESSRDNDKISDQKINFSALWDISNNRLISEVSITNTTASY